MLVSFRPATWQRIRMIVLPGATPRSSWQVVLAALIGTTRGFGSAHYAAFQTFNPTGVLGWTALLVALLDALNGVVTLIERRLLRWRPVARPA